MHEVTNYLPMMNCHQSMISNISKVIDGRDCAFVLFLIFTPDLLHLVYSSCPQHVVYDMAGVHVRMQLQERSQIIFR